VPAAIQIGSAGDASSMPAWSERCCLGTKIRFASAGWAVSARIAASARERAARRAVPMRARTGEVRANPRVLFPNRESLRALVGARHDEHVGVGAQIFSRGGLRVRGRDGADNRGVALDVVEAEVVDLRAQELVRHTGVRLEADGEDAGQISLRGLHLIVRRALI